MDVRMLGKGRPFVMEVANARARMPPRETFTQIEAALNASGVGVEVRQLQPVDRTALTLIKARVRAVQRCDDMLQFRSTPLMETNFSGGLQAGEQEKRKSYLAKCRLPCHVTACMLEKLNKTKDLLLKQLTPTRVEHRRSMLVTD
jgi:tRNA pseudouridine synthase 10